MTDPNLPDGCTQKEIDRQWGDHEELDLLRHNSTVAEEIVSTIWDDFINREGVEFHDGLDGAQENELKITWADKIDEILERRKR